MSLLRRRSVFAAKVETTPGTAETLAAADGAFNAMNVLIQPSIEMADREGQGGFNYLAGVPGIRSGTATFETELSYDGENIPTWASVLLPACGWVNTAGVFAPVSRGPGAGATLPKTLTIGAYVDGTFRVLAGCMGTFVINLPTGRMATISWTFTGKWVANPIDTGLISPTYPTAKGLRFAAGGIEWDEVGLCVESVAVDAGNEVIARECASDITGIITALVTNRRPTITAAPEAVLVATQNRHGQWLNMDTEPLEIVIPSAGNAEVAIDAPAAQIQNIQQGERNGLVTDDITWMATKGSTPDTELTITFTEDTSE